MRRRDIYILSYLLIPYIIFFVFWYRWFITIPCIAFILFSLYHMSKARDIGEPDWQNSDMIAILVLLAWVGFSGIGGAVFQNYDWHKHNAILADLVRYEWPLVYHNDQPYLLIYYIAFYLPSAMIGKVFGNSFVAAQIFLYIWSVIGMIIVYREIKSIFPKKTLIVLLLFVVFSGMDVIGIFYKESVDWLINPTQHIENWSLPVAIEYSSFTTLLFWVPQHAIAGWVITLMLYRYQEEVHSVFLLWGISIFYSPFIFIGLFPFIGYIVIKNIKKKKARQYITISNITGLMLALIVGLYLISGSSGSSISFLWQDSAVSNVWVVYFVFIVTEVLLLSFALLFSKLSKKEPKGWLYLSIGILIVLPLIKYGHFNDLCMRASIPALLILFIFTIKSLFSPNNKRYLRIAILVILLIGAISPAIEFSRTAYKTIKKESVKNHADSTLFEAVNKRFLGNYIDSDMDHNWVYRYFLQKEKE